jgi:hypothetical protein
MQPTFVLQLPVARFRFHPTASRRTLGMARLRLGYTKSRTGCLRCKQRRVKVCFPFRAPLCPDAPRKPTNTRR